MDKKFSKEYRRKTWIIAIYDSDDQGSWMGKIEATKKEVKEILAAIVQSLEIEILIFMKVELRLLKMYEKIGNL